MILAGQRGIGGNRSLGIIEHLGGGARFDFALRVGEILECRDEVVAVAIAGDGAVRVALGVAERIGFGLGRQGFREPFRLGRIDRPRNRLHPAHDRLDLHVVAVDGLLDGGVERLVVQALRGEIGRDAGCGVGRLARVEARHGGVDVGRRHVARAIVQLVEQLRVGGDLVGQFVLGTRGRGVEPSVDALVHQRKRQAHQRIGKHRLRIVPLFLRGEFVVAGGLQGFRVRAAVGDAAGEVHRATFQHAGCQRTLFAADRAHRFEGACGDGARFGRGASIDALRFKLTGALVTLGAGGEFEAARATRQHRADADAHQRIDGTEQQVPCSASRMRIGPVHLIGRRTQIRHLLRGFLGGVIHLAAQGVGRGLEWCASAVAFGLTGKVAEIMRAGH
ncbi:MAG TPA: hypothetical protein VFN69_04420 [Rudaea sp.]|nr:hypothetical protein [Rudaea sp.]